MPERYINRYLIIKISVPEIIGFTFFLEYLPKNKLLPFSNKDLQSYLRKSKEISSDNSNIEKNTIELYDLISNFHIRLNTLE